MPSYVLLSRYTEQGMRKVKQSPKRIDDLKKKFRKESAEIKQVLLLMGRYDTMLIVEAPDDETVARLSLALGSAGNVRTETLRAFNESEFRQLVGSLP